MSASSMAHSENCKNLPKIRLKKILKLIDHAYDYNSVRNFEYEWNEMKLPEREYVNLLKFF